MLLQAASAQATYHEVDLDEEVKGLFPPFSRPPSYQSCRLEVGVLRYRCTHVSYNHFSMYSHIDVDMY